MEGDTGGIGFSAQGSTGAYTAQVDVDNLDSDVQSNVYTLLKTVCYLK